MLSDKDSHSCPTVLFQTPNTALKALRTSLFAPSTASVASAKHQAPRAQRVHTHPAPPASKFRALAALHIFAPSTHQPHTASRAPRRGAAGEVGTRHRSGVPARSVQASPKLRPRRGARSNMFRAPVFTFRVPGKGTALMQICFCAAKDLFARTPAFYRRPCFVAPGHAKTGTGTQSARCQSLCFARFRSAMHGCAGPRKNRDVRLLNSWHYLPTRQIAAKNRDWYAALSCTCTSLFAAARFSTAPHARKPHCSPCILPGFALPCFVALRAAKTGTGTPRSRCQSLCFAQVAPGCALLCPAGCGFGPGESEGACIWNRGCGNTGQCLVVRLASWPASRQCECAHAVKCAKAFWQLNALPGAKTTRAIKRRASPRSTRGLGRLARVCPHLPGRAVAVLREILINAAVRPKAAKKRPKQSGPRRAVLKNPCVLSRFFNRGRRGLIYELAEENHEQKPQEENSECQRKAQTAFLTNARRNARKPKRALPLSFRLSAPLPLRPPRTHRAPTAHPPRPLR